MLLVVIPAVLLAVALLGLGMCRLAALSDRHHAAALEEWILATRLSRQRPPVAEQRPFDAPGGRFHATG